MLQGGRRAVRPPVSTRGPTSGSQDANSRTQTLSSVPLCFVSFCTVCPPLFKSGPCASSRVTCCLTTHQTEPMKLINRQRLTCTKTVLHWRAPPEVQLETSPWSNMLAWKRLPASSPLTGQFQGHIVSRRRTPSRRAGYVHCLLVLCAV